MSDTLYEEISFDENSEFQGRYKQVSLNEKDIKKLKDFLKRHKVLDKEIEISSPFNKKVISIKRLKDVKYKDVVSNWLWSKDQSTEYIMNYDIKKFEDEWWLVLDRFCEEDVKYIKCDQIDGVFQYFEDEFKELTKPRYKMIQKFKEFIKR